MKKLLFFVLICTFINISGCASSQYKFEYQQEQVDVIWPPPPEVPRIKYLGVIKGENNFHKTVLSLRKNNGKLHKEES